MTESHPHDLLPAYALGCLDADELKLVRNHLQTCTICRAEVAELQKVNDLLACAVPTQSPDSSLKGRVLKKCRPQKRFVWFDALLNRWPRFVPTAAACSLILLVLLGTTNLLSLLTPAQQVAGDSLKKVKIINLRGESSASGQLLMNPKASEGLLIVNALQPLSKELQYQLWLIRDGKRTSGGVFSVNQDGAANILISSAEPFAIYDSFGITIEPHGGSPGPTGKKVLGGKVHL